jgi:hypothetical protein
MVGGFGTDRREKNRSGTISALRGSIAPRRRERALECQEILHRHRRVGRMGCRCCARFPASLMPFTAMLWRTQGYQSGGRPSVSPTISALPAVSPGASNIGISIGSRGTREVIRPQLRRHDRERLTSARTRLRHPPPTATGRQSAAVSRRFAPRRPNRLAQTTVEVVEGLDRPKLPGCRDAHDHRRLIAGKVTTLLTVGVRRQECRLWSHDI